MFKFKISKKTIKHAQAGSKDAFDQIALFYNKKILNFCLRYTGNKEDAEDISQEVFLKAFENIRKYDYSAGFSTWLFTIARNTVYDSFRKKKNHSALALDTLVNFETKIKGFNPKPEVKINQKIDIDIALKAVKPEYRRVLQLFYWKGLNYKEIAKVMKLPINTVRTYLNRAKKTMAIFLSKPFRKK